MSANARAGPRAPLMLAALIGVASVCVVAEASAHETRLGGRGTVEKYCGNSCHSLDYITMNAPILDDEGWALDINKMIDALGAPNGSDETKIILDYLVKNYGTATHIRSTQGR